METRRFGEEKCSGCAEFVEGNPVAGGALVGQKFQPFMARPAMATTARDGGVKGFAADADGAVVADAGREEFALEVGADGCGWLQEWSLWWTARGVFASSDAGRVITITRSGRSGEVWDNATTTVPACKPPPPEP